MKRLNLKTISFWIRKRDALLKQLTHPKPFINGAIVKMARKCGNKNCKCARGEKHVSDYFSYRDKYKKRTNMIYIPIDMIEEVKKWNEEYKRMKEIMGEICEIQRKIIKQYVKEKKKPRKHS